MKKSLSFILALTMISSCLALVGCNVFGELFDTTSTQPSTTTTTKLTTTTTTTTGSSSDTGEIVWEEKQYVDLSLRDDFVPGGVIVLLDRRISEPNKVHEKEFFVGVEIEEIVDLTQRTNPVDPDEDFHQILWIVLVDKSKEAVIEAATILMEIQGIVTAHPDYYVYSETVPNDPYYSFTTTSSDQWGLDSIDISLVWDFSTTRTRYPSCNNLVLILITPQSAG